MTEISRAELDALRAALKNKETSSWEIGDAVFAIVGPKSGVGKKDGSQAKLKEIETDLAADFPMYTLAMLAKLRNTRQGFPNGVPPNIAWSACEAARSAERLTEALRRLQPGLGNKAPLRDDIRDALKHYDDEVKEKARDEAIGRYEAAQANHEVAKDAHKAAMDAKAALGQFDNDVEAGQVVLKAWRALEKAATEVTDAKNAIPRERSEPRNGPTFRAQDLNKAITALHRHLPDAKSMFAPGASTKLADRLEELAFEISDMVVLLRSRGDKAEVSEIDAEMTDEAAA